MQHGPDSLPTDGVHGDEDEALENADDEGQVEDTDGPPFVPGEDEGGEGGEDQPAHPAPDEKYGSDPTRNVQLLSDPRVAGSVLPRQEKT